MRSHDRQEPAGPRNPLDVQVSDSAVRVRNAKNPNGPVLEFDRRTWREFLDAVRAGEFDVS